MVGNDLAHQGEPQPGAVFTSRDKGFKNIIFYLVGQARTVINDFDLQRQKPPRSVRTPQTERMLIERANGDRPALGPCGLGRVF